ncbi:DUF4347 domain-containing protein [Argonema galeatum]|uniref:DUF4347 domain-containing protein n=1 Tax=Argonema galeatum TaxID=2942762 RepID=UPI0020118973|nr:DUF4347 domain-containing protein [Argonema galeatum]MCL1467457.1 Ig-like domain-containing protein [Argonema galeatum A003/A1]
MLKDTRSINKRLTDNTLSQSIVFVDVAVGDYESLIAGLQPGIEAVLLVPSQDGVSQITAALAQRAGISSIHIVSHGSEGSLRIGSGVLNGENLESFSSQLQQWRNALTEEADILLYGCCVAAGKVGRAFVQALSQLSGAKVAASTNLTGNSTLGGDWNLEFITGKIKTALAFSPQVTPPSPTQPKLPFTENALKTYSGILGFATKVDFTTGTRPISVSIGDFNGDGKPDLALANFNSNSTSILLNTTATGATTPTFATNVDFPTGSNPISVSSGDFNGDGLPDLAVANYFSNTTSIFLNTTTVATTPTFATNVDFTTGTRPISVSIGDFNGDGKPDLALANAASNTTSIFLNNTATAATTPTFATKVDFTTGTNPKSVSIGDFNGDGKPDLAVANYGSNTTSIFLNTTTVATTPTFATKVDFTTGTNPKSVSIGDFNGDSKPDLAVANQNSNTTSILLNNTPTGATTPTFATKVDFTTGTNPISVSIGDFNGDSKPDLALANQVSNTTSILLNSTPKVSIAAGTTPTETGPTTGTFNITLDTAAPAGGLVVNFDTIGSTAATPAHYSLTAGTNITAVTANTFTIAAGVTTAVLNAVPVDDAIVNPGETVKVNVTADTGFNYILDPVVANTTATLTITDNDFPTVNLSVSPVTSTETGSPAITVTATASSAVVGDQTVNVALSGTAAPADFTGTIPTSITIPAGQTTGSFTVNVNDDTLVEGTETGTFTISTPSSGVTLGTTTTGSVAITDNDVADTTPPTATTFTPADNATSVAVAANLVVTLSEAVLKGTGNLVIKKVSDNSVVETIDVTSANVTVSGSSVTVNPTADLLPGTDYYVEIAAGAIKDVAGNNYAGITGATAWNFTTATAPDTIAPTATTFTPADNATSVAVAANLVVTLSEAVLKGTGNLVIKKVSDNSVVETIDVTSANVTVSGSTVTVNPTADLLPGTDYYVEIAAGAIKDLANNNYAGITGATAWNFTTATAPDTIAPTATTFTPADNATSVAVAANLVVTLSEAVLKGTGNLVIKKVSDNSVVETIDVTSANVTVSGSTVTVNPTADLAPGTDYYVEIAAGAIQDLANNNYAGITGATAWNFTTVDTTPPTVTSITSSLANGNYGVGSVIPITVSFSEPVTVTNKPELTLNSGGKATYTSGSGTNSLTFNYTVGQGQNAPDLDYASTNALSLAGGTIKDAANNNATLSLPAPGATSSLGAAKAIVIKTDVEINALDLGFNKLQESLTNNLAAQIPVVGDKLKAIAPDFLNSIKNRLITDLKAAPSWDAVNFQDTIKTSLGKDFPNLRITGSVGANGEAKVLVNLRKEYTKTLKLDANLGLPALGFNTQGDANATFKYGLYLGLGLNQDGIFFDTTNTKLTLGAEVGLANNFTGKANLGFLQLDLRTNGTNPTKISGDFKASLKDLTPAQGGIDDGRLTFNELSKGNYKLSDLIGTSLDAKANLGLSAKTSINGSAAIPSFNFDLNAAFPVLKYENGKWSGPQKPQLAFKNMQLDLGSLITNFAKPVITKVNDILKPARPIINALNSDIKPLSQFSPIKNFFDQNGDGKVTLLEAGATVAGKKIDTRFLDGIEYIGKASDLLKDISSQNGNIAIDLGDYAIDFDATDPKADTKTAKTTQTKSAASSTDQAKSKSQGKTQELLSLFQKMDGLSLPILTNPGTAIDLLMGKPDVTLFAYKVPKLDFNFNIDKTFPIYSIPVVNIGVNGKLQGNFEAKANFAFGFDTSGLSQWKQSGFNASDAYKVLDGLYVSDRQNADGTGPDVNELKLKASIKAGGGVDAFVAKAYLTGGIEANAKFDLLDVGEDQSKGTSGDGKIHASEITSRISNPLSLFEINGEVKAVLDFKAEYKKYLLFGGWTTAYEKRLGEMKLADFRLGTGSTRKSRAIDGYITGGEVFFDANFNRVQDDNEPFAFTNPDGSFDLTVELEKFDKNQDGKIDYTEGKIIMANGIDISTYLPLDTQLSSTPESTVVTPLTTVIAALAEQGTNPETAQTQVKSALGLPAGVDLGSYDPLEAIANDDANGVSVFATMIMVQNTIVQTAKLIEGVSQMPLTQLGNAATAAIAETFKAGTPVDLSKVETIQPIVQNAIAAAAILDSNINASQLSSVAATAATVMALGNQIVKELAASGRPIKDIALEITKLQAVSVGQIAVGLPELAAGTLTIEQFLANNTKESIQEKMGQVRVIDPTLRPTFETIDPEDLLVRSDGSTGGGDSSDASSSTSLPPITRLPEFNGIFFDPTFYLGRNSDVAAAVQSGAFRTPIEHFSKFGFTEGRAPSAMFASDYLTNNQDVADAVTKGVFKGGFEHFIKHGLAEGRDPSSRLAPFDMFYLAENPDVAQAVKQGSFKNGLEHLINFGMLEGRDPQPRYSVVVETFDPTFYSTNNLDVAEAVQKGLFRNSFEHFVHFGMKENRNPSLLFNNSDYLGQNSDVAPAVTQGLFKSGFEHFMKFGMSEGRVGATIVGSAVADRLEANAGANIINGRSGNDTLMGAGGNDQLYGNQGDDFLNGNQGKDNVYGGQGNDVIYGGKDDDLISGDLGNDLLVGDLGNDTLIGGPGNDTFVLGSNTGVDTLVDFQVGLDRLGLSGGLKFEQLAISQGTGISAQDTLVRIAANDELLAILSNVSASSIANAAFTVV